MLYDFAFTVISTAVYTSDTRGVGGVREREREEGGKRGGREREEGGKRGGRERELLNLFSPLFFTLVQSGVCINELHLLSNVHLNTHTHTHTHTRGGGGGVNHIKRAKRETKLVSILPDPLPPWLYCQQSPQTKHPSGVCVCVSVHTQNTPCTVIPR